MLADGNPRASIVIPVWDAYAGEGLAQAVASAADQSMSAAVIIVDNASRVPLPASAGVDYVRLERRVSTGAARNAALARVRTPYVVFLDADDLLLDGALQRLVDGLDADPRRVTHTLSIIDERTGRRHRSPRTLARWLSRAPRLFALANTIWSLLPTQGCTIMRVDDVRGCGGYGDSSHGEDWVLAVSLAFRGRVAFEALPGLVYRPRSDSPGVRALGPTVLQENAQRVRTRIRTDPAIPATVKLALPLIAIAQWVAARIAHPAYREARLLIKRRAS